jgi:hypothetical protein
MFSGISQINVQTNPAFFKLKPVIARERGALVIMG